MANPFRPDHDDEHVHVHLHLGEHPLAISISLNVTVSPDADLLTQLAQLSKLSTLLDNFTRLERKVDKIMMTDQELAALLTKVDATTSKIGGNIDTVATVVQKEADTLQTIIDEVDALIAAGKANGSISDANANALQSIADRLQASSDKSDTAVSALQAQVPVLDGIAAKGTPTVPEPPPAPVV